MRTLRKLGAAPATRLSVSGPYFVDPSGQIVIRRSLTAFTAPKRFMEGRDADANRYFDWAAAQGFNEVRVFSRTNWTGPPNSGVETGWPFSEGDCGFMLHEAEKRGLRVEVVALTYASPIDEMVAQVQRVDELCLRHDNAMLELTNEPDVNGIDVAAVLARYTPRTPGWSSGYYLCPPDPRGPSLTYHSPRKSSWARCFKDAYEFSTGAGPIAPFQPPYLGPVMLDEPPQVEQTIRDEGSWPAEQDWEAYGAGAAFFAAGATMHGYPGFQRCEIPTDARVLACVRAFHAGFDAVPVQRYQSYNRGDQPTPGDDGSRRYFRWDEDGRCYEICVHPFSFRAL